jgi:hypothetical protein
MIVRQADELKAEASPRREAGAQGARLDFAGLEETSQARTSPSTLLRTRTSPRREDQNVCYAGCFAAQPPSYISTAFFGLALYQL